MNEFLAHDEPESTPPLPLYRPSASPSITFSFRLVFVAHFWLGCVFLFLLHSLARSLAATLRGCPSTATATAMATAPLLRFRLHLLQWLCGCGFCLNLFRFCANIIGCTFVAPFSVPFPFLHLFQGVAPPPRCCTWHKNTFPQGVARGCTL